MPNGKKTPADRLSQSQVSITSKSQLQPPICRVNQSQPSVMVTVTVSNGEVRQLLGCQGPVTEVKAAVTLHCLCTHTRVHAHAHRSQWPLADLSCSTASSYWSGQQARVLQICCRCGRTQTHGCMHTNWERHFFLRMLSPGIASVGLVCVVSMFICKSVLKLLNGYDKNTTI